MMSAGRYASRLHSLFKITARSFCVSRTSQKKYNYDLDSLIEWKKETTQGFGPVLKLTKTGKVRKTKKPIDPQIEENLRITSVISSSTENTWIICSNDLVGRSNESDKSYLEDTTLISSTILPASDTVLINEKTKRVGFIEDPTDSMKDGYCDVPDAVLMSCAVPPDTWPVSNESFIDKEQNDVSEHNIVIPKLSPIPTSKSEAATWEFKGTLIQNKGPPVADKQFPIRKNTKSQSFQSMGSLNSEDFFVTKISNLKNTESVLKKSEISKTNKRRFVKIKEETNSVCISDEKSESYTEKERADDILLPKIKPIPLGNPLQSLSVTSSSSPFVSSMPSPQSSATETLQHLPLESPESFDIISKIPLFPVGNNGWQKGIDSHQFDAFRMDIDQMSLRTLPSVKSILNKTMSELNRFFLNRWREGLIRELGEEGFKQHQEATIRSGINLHANIMEYLSGKPVSDLQIMPENQGHWCSIQSALTAIADVRALEVEISHNLLYYRGVFDCLAQYRDLLCMIDWKTSKKPRPLLKNTYDDPLQVAAYIGALNANENYVKKYGQVNHGVIVVAYPDGSPAHIHVMNKTVCEQYWQDWTARLYNYFQLTYTEKMAVTLERGKAKKQLSSAAGGQ